MYKIIRSLFEKTRGAYLVTFVVKKKTIGKEEVWGGVNNN